MAGIGPEYRLAHTAQGLGEFIDILIGWHVTGLEMHLGNFAVILLDEPHQNFRIDAAGIFVDPTHDPEIQRDQVTVCGDFQVALVHIRMKIPVTQCVA